MDAPRTKLDAVLTGQGRRMEWVARRLAVSLSTVSRWCSGERVIPLARAHELAELLDVGVMDICEEANEGATARS